MNKAVPEIVRVSSALSYGRGRWWFAFVVAWVLSLAAAQAETNVVVENQTYPSGQVTTVTATETIAASTAVTVTSGANVTYAAGTKITLGPGFRANNGAAFRAYAGDADQDGMPDGWEIQQFGSTAQSATGDPDGDSLDNLTEFLLGTNPGAGNNSDLSNQAQLKVHRPIP